MSALSLSVKAKLFLFFLWMLALVVINPFGEYPINDDWAYARNVYDLVVNGKFIVDPWPAMNLVSQTIYGSIFAGLFGFSFTVRRISIFVLALFSSFFLYYLGFNLSSSNLWIAFCVFIFFFFFFSVTEPTVISTFSLHEALPIFSGWQFLFLPLFLLLCFMIWHLNFLPVNIG